MKTIWESVPVHLASSHQIGAMTVLTAYLMAMHTCRRIDHRHMRNLLGKLRIEDPQAFQQVANSYKSNMLSKREYEALKSEYLKK